MYSNNLTGKARHMISNHKIQAALDEIKEISKIDLALYTDKGKQVAATFETEGDMEYAVNSFAGSMAESQMLSGCHFFKVYVDGELEYVLFDQIFCGGCVHGRKTGSLPDSDACVCLYGAV